MDNRTAFIAGALLDTQSTIRAIDVKIGALLVGILAPVASLGRIFAHLDHVASSSQCKAYILFAWTFPVFWVLALFSLVMALGAIDNPARHIIGSEKQKGIFYGGGIFELGMLDAFLNRHSVRAKRDIAAFLSDMPNDRETIDAELAFEQMKLIYIRDSKINRLWWGQIYAFLWLVNGIAVFLISRYAS